MAHSILLEGHNLTLKHGTGIATYARVLAASLRNLGFFTELLVGARCSIDRRDPVLNEVGLFDAVADLPPPLMQRAARAPAPIRCTSAAPATRHQATKPQLTVIQKSAAR